MIKAKDAELNYGRWSRMKSTLLRLLVNSTLDSSELFLMLSERKASPLRTLCSPSILY